MNKEQLKPNDAEFDQEYRKAYLVAAYIQQKLTPAEREELDDWVGASKENLLLFEDLIDDKKLNNTLRWFHKLDVEKAKRRVHGKINFETKRSLWQVILPYTIAACILIIAGSGIWYYQYGRQNAIRISERPPKVEPIPGGNKAILTLANGHRIVLDSAANGSLVIDGETNIIKSDSLLNYTAIKNHPDEAVFNTLEVPKGGKYQLVLSDGSKIWLNSASILRFPAVFIGSERRIHLAGEAYLEVAENKEMPFVVDVEAADVTVLGTHFNVRAYNDEVAMQASLLEGSIQVSNNTSKATLKRGQGAQVMNEGVKGIKVIEDADLEKAVGWKNGHFVFRDEELKVIMRELERWYDINVVFKEDIPRHFSGTFNRTEPLNKILHYLEGTNEVRFDLKGKNVTVLK